MGLRIDQEDRVEAVGYGTGYSAQGLLYSLVSEHGSKDWSTLEEDPDRLYVYDNKRYRVTIVIEEA